MDPATEPLYATLASWNAQLHSCNWHITTLTGPGTPINVNNAAYDIGHMFGAGRRWKRRLYRLRLCRWRSQRYRATKGRGITSPADGIPQGDNFDIDYVAHEVVTSWVATTHLRTRTKAPWRNVK